MNYVETSEIKDLFNRCTSIIVYHVLKARNEEKMLPLLCNVLFSLRFLEFTTT